MMEMNEKEKEKWAEGIAEALVKAEEMIMGAMGCRCGCDAELAKRYGEEVLVPVLRKIVIDYLEMRGIMGMVGKVMKGGGEKNEGTTNGISTSGLN